MDSSHVSYHKDTNVFMHQQLSRNKMELKDYNWVCVLTLALTTGKNRAVVISRTWMMKKVGFFFK